MPVTHQRTLERRHLHPERPRVRMLRFAALRLGKGLLRRLQRPVLDGLPSLRDRPGERLLAKLPVDRPDALCGAGVVGVELDDAPERRPLLAELPGGAGVLRLPAFGQQLRQPRHARFPELRLRIAGSLRQGLLDVHPGGLRVPRRIRLLGGLQAEPEAGFLVADELLRLPLRLGQEPQRRIDIAVAMGFEGLRPAEPDPVQRGVEFGVGRCPGRTGQQGGFEAAEHVLDLRPLRRVVARRILR